MDYLILSLGILGTLFANMFAMMHFLKPIQAQLGRIQIQLDRTEDKYDRRFDRIERSIDEMRKDILELYREKVGQFSMQ